MSLIVPVMSKHRFNNQNKIVYTCPSNKSHAIVDLSFFLDTKSTTKAKSTISVHLTTNTTSIDKANIYQKDIVVDNINPTTSTDKIIVGKGQKLIVITSGTAPVNVRVSGIEENNPHVLKAGRLGYQHKSIKGIIELFRLDTPLASYCTGSIIVSNVSNATGRYTLWVTDNVEVKVANDEDRLVDQIATLTLEPNESVTIEDVTLKPNERIYIDSSPTTTKLAMFVGTVIDASLS